MIMLNKYFLTLLVVFSLPVCGEINHQEAHVLIGEAKLKFFIWPVYEARLFSNKKDLTYPDSLPFTLELTYKRAISRQNLLDETLRQWEVMNIIPDGTWLQFLHETLPDVSKNDVISMNVNSDWKSTLYFNGEIIGALEESNFSKAFAAIWLSEQSNRPKLRNDLLKRE